MNGVPLLEKSETNMGNVNLSFGMAESMSAYPYFMRDEEVNKYEEELRKEIEDQIIKAYQKKLEDSKPFSFEDVLPVFKEGVEAIVKDSFIECFRPKPPIRWNFNAVLFVFWIFGVLLRYLILFPLR